MVLHGLWVCAEVPVSEGEIHLFPGVQISNPAKLEGFSGDRMEWVCHFPESPSPNAPTARFFLRSTSLLVPLDLTLIWEELPAEQKTPGYRSTLLVFNLPKTVKPINLLAEISASNREGTEWKHVQSVRVVPPLPRNLWKDLTKNRTLWVEASLPKLQEELVAHSVSFTEFTDNIRPVPGDLFIATLPAGEDAGDLWAGSHGSFADVLWLEHRPGETAQVKILEKTKGTMVILSTPFDFSGKVTTPREERLLQQALAPFTIHHPPVMPERKP